MSTKLPDIQKPGNSNYPQWAGEVQTWLRAHQLWQLVSGQTPKPFVNAQLFQALLDKGEALEEAVQAIKNLRPASFTLDTLDDELLSMAIIRALPEEYSHFVTSLMLSDKLEKATILQAFHIAEIQRTKSAAPQVAELANKATSSSFGYRKAKPANNLPCDFCRRTNHVMENCHQFKIKQAEAQFHALNKQQQ